MEGTITKTVQVLYFAALREVAGRNAETWKTSARTPLELYRQVQDLYAFPYAAEQLRVAVNDSFCRWDDPLPNGVDVAFIAPVAGG